MNQFILDLDHGMSGTDESGPYETKWQKIGTILVPTGRIVACDPYIYPLGPEYDPFVKVVPPGRYQVFLHRLFSESSTDGRVAHAMLRFGDGRVAHWELATTKGQDMRKLKEGEIFGYAVDAGVGCFMDLETAKLLRFRIDEVDKEGDFWDLVNRDEKNWGEQVLNHVGYNVFCFQSGYGDGFYPTYWGYDEEEKPVCLVTEFIQL
jgi:hypothetical protein